jgi:metal-responsive CopG/Arc/MetJ family transcriptional regulator
MNKKRISLYLDTDLVERIDQSSETYSRNAFLGNELTRLFIENGSDNK